MTMTAKMTATKIAAALFTALAMGGAATVASAQASMDTDGDGAYSLTELQAAFPDLTEEAFIAIDTSGDGMVDEAELKVAQDGGLLPANG